MAQEAFENCEEKLETTTKNKLETCLKLFKKKYIRNLNITIKNSADLVHNFNKTVYNLSVSIEKDGLNLREKVNLIKKLF